MNLMSDGESGIWPFLVQNWKIIGSRLLPIVAFFALIAVFSYWGATPWILTGVIIAGIGLLVAFSYVSEMQTSLLIKALSLPVLVIIALLAATDLIPTSAFIVAVAFAAIAFGLTLGKVID